MMEGIMNIENQMETIFISRNLWEIIEEDYEEHVEEENEGASKQSPDQERKSYMKNKKWNALPLRLIQQGVS